MPKPELAGLRVLVVEDESLVSMLLEDVLEDWGCEILGPAAHLAAARDLVLRNRPDGAILDVNLGGEPVYPLVELLEERHIPFLFVTGYGRATIAECFRRHPVLAKPFRPAELHDVLAALLRGNHDAVSK